MIITLPLVEDGHPISEITIELKEVETRTIQIVVNAGPLKNKIFQDLDYFSALRALRLGLEERKLLIGCIGGLKNFYPSNMAIDMAQGMVGYLMTIGETASRNNMAKTFEKIDNFSELASVEDQLAFYKKWRSSLNPVF